MFKSKLFRAEASVARGFIRFVALLGDASFGILRCPQRVACFHPKNTPSIQSRITKIREDDCTTDFSVNAENLRVLSTTDFHMRYCGDYNDGGSLPYTDRKTSYMLMRNIGELAPDFVVITGDTILSKSKFLNLVDTVHFARMMERTGVYWAFVLGNHEVQQEKGMYKYLIISLLSRFRHCVTKPGKEKLFGYGNFTVNFKNPDGSLRQSVFCFDSGDRIIPAFNSQHNCPFDKGYDYLKNSQIEFYRSETDRIVSQYGKAPTLMYMHIPLYQYGLFFDEPEPWNFRYNGTGKLLYGRQYESVGCAPFDSGMFDAIKEKNQSVAVFAGHDHINDWCAELDGVTLGYSQPGGYSAYELGTARGMPERQWQNGVTAVDIGKGGNRKITPYLNSRFFGDDNDRQKN